MDKAVRTGAAPFISVIVPVYRQWAEASMFIDCWQMQKLAAGDAELILVDNGFESGEFVANELHLPEYARVVMCRKPGSYAARSAGAAVASGRWLVFTDADCRPDPDWLAALRREMERTPRDLLAGMVKMVADPPATAWACYDLVRGIPQGRYVSRGYAATANLAVPHDAFLECGGFDTSRFSGGDADFCWRAKERGRRIRFVSDAVVGHPARQSWEALRTKARRVKGAQLMHSRGRRRLYWLMRTCLPPLHEMVALVGSGEHRWRDRISACGIRLCLWTVELREGLRLLSGSSDLERR